MLHFPIKTLKRFLGEVGWLKKKLICIKKKMNLYSFILLMQHLNA